jgi:hypothetical protein
MSWEELFNVGVWYMIPTLLGSTEADEQVPVEDVEPPEDDPLEVESACSRCTCVERLLGIVPAVDA